MTNDNDHVFQDLASAVQEIDRLKNIIKLTNRECLAGGFVRGLAFRPGLQFDNWDKEMLETAGKCIARIMNQKEAKL